MLAAAFHPREMVLVTASEDSEIRVWDLMTKACSAVLQGHFSAVTSLAISADGKALLSGSRDGVCITWDLGQRAKRATTAVMEAVEAVAILPPGCALGAGVKPAKGSLLFATGGEKGRVRVWRGDKGTTVAASAAEGGCEGEEAPEGAVACLVGGAAPGQPLVATTQDGRLRVFAAERSVAEPPRQLVGNNDEVTDLRILDAPGAERRVAVASNSGVIRLFSLPRFDCVASMAGHTAAVLSLDVATRADGRQILVSGSKDCSVRLWDAGATRCLGVGEGHVAAVAAVALSRRRPGAFCASAGADRVLKIWDTGAGLDEPKLRATAAVAAHDKDINAVAVSPDDRVVVTGSQDKTARVWRLPELIAGPVLRGHRRGIWSVAFSPVDQVVATASADATLRLWSVADGACLRALEGHLASALRVCWVSLGSQLVSAGADGLLKLWAARTGECLHTADAAEDKVWALDAADDGAVLVTGSGDGRLVQWRDATAETASDALAASDAAVAADQAYANALAAGDWAAAARTALERDQPRRLLAAVNAVLDKADESDVQV